MKRLETFASDEGVKRRIKIEKNGFTIETESETSSARVFFAHS